MTNPKENLIYHFDQIIGAKETTNTLLDQIANDVLEAKEINIKEIDLYKKQKEFVKSVPAILFNNGELIPEAFVASATALAKEEYQYTNRVNLKIENSKNAIGFIVSTLSTSTSAVISYGVCSAFSETQKENPEMKDSYFFLSQQTILEEKTRIANLLNEIDPTLKKMFEDAWSVYLTMEYSERGFIHPAHSLRETLSELLNVLSPNAEVKKMSGCELDDSGNPTQISKVKYAIFGSNYDDEVMRISFPMVEEIAKQVRALYSNLNGYVHYRKNERPFDCDEKYRMFFALTQGLIEKIIVMRKQYFSY